MPSRPRILFCTQSAYQCGGVEIWLETLAPTLRDYDWDVRVALARGRQFHRPELARGRFPDCRCVELDGRSGYPEQRQVALRRCFESIRPDVIVPVQLADALYAAAAWTRGQERARLVTCLHGQFTDRIADLRRCAEDIDHGVSVSRRARARLVSEAGLPETATSHIPTGVPAPQLTVKTVRDASARLEIAYVGRLCHQEKRVLDLIRLVPQIVQHADVLHVVGDGPDAQALREGLLSGAGGLDIRFHGELSRGALYRDVYPRIGALLILSPAEGGPLTAWEALVHGVVPVTSDYAGRREEGVLVHDRNALVFGVGDMTAAAACIARLRDGACRGRLVDGALDAGRLFSMGSFGRAWDDCLRHVVSSPGRAGRGHPGLPRSSGRLSRCVQNDALLAWFRRWLCRPYAHTAPGGEWPHSYNGLITSKDELT